MNQYWSRSNWRVRLRRYQTRCPHSRHYTAQGNQLNAPFLKVNRPTGYLTESQASLSESGSVNRAVLTPRGMTRPLERETGESC